MEWNEETSQSLQEEQQDIMFPGLSEKVQTPEEEYLSIIVMMEKCRARRERILSNYLI